MLPRNVALLPSEAAAGPPCLCRFSPHTVQCLRQAFCPSSWWTLFLHAPLRCHLQKSSSDLSVCCSLQNSIQLHTTFKNSPFTRVWVCVCVCTCACARARVWSASEYKFQGSKAISCWCYIPTQPMCLPLRCWWKFEVLNAFRQKSVLIGVKMRLTSNGRGMIFDKLTRM